MAQVWFFLMAVSFGSEEVGVEENINFRRSGGKNRKSVNPSGLANKAGAESVSASDLMSGIRFEFVCS